MYSSSTGVDIVTISCHSKHSTTCKDVTGNNMKSDYNQKVILVHTTMCSYVQVCVDFGCD